MSCFEIVLDCLHTLRHLLEGSLRYWKDRHSGDMTEMMMSPLVRLRKVDYCIKIIKGVNNTKALDTAANRIRFFRTMLRLLFDPFVLTIRIGMLEPDFVTKGIRVSSLSSNSSIQVIMSTRLRV